jgi:nucleoside-diphosphate-sugar epimerase
MNILITGGSGYKGSILIPKLLKNNHTIYNIDTNWFGNFLPKHERLLNIKQDIRYFKFDIKKKVDAIIHLASIANDPMADLDKNLSWEISLLGTKKLIETAIQKKIKRFIYASSGSVYGIKKESKVHENLPLEPISLYNKVKMTTERLILSYKKDIELFIIRPATVCGYSPRMRYDLTVNALTYSALKNGTISVFGGNQIRPNIHIQDITDLYIFLLNTNKKNCGIYNAGFENLSVTQIAKEVQKIIPAKIEIIKSKIDLRSYRLDSSKLESIGFKKSKGIIDAIMELSLNFQKGFLKENPRFFSTSWLKKIKIS